MSAKTNLDGLKLLKLAYFEFHTINELHRSQPKTRQPDSKEIREKPLKIKNNQLDMPQPLENAENTVA